MHIAVDGRVVTDHFPGIGRYTYQLLDALAELAPNDRFTVMWHPGQYDRRYDLSLLGQRPNVDLCAVDAGVFTPSAPFRLSRALRAAGVDLFHATYWSSAIGPRGPLALSLYDLIGPRVPGSVPTLRRLALGLALRAALRRADHVITLSKWSAHDIEVIGRVSPDRITVTPLAADDHFHPVDRHRVADMRDRLGLPRRYVLYVGINKPHKNLDTLVTAWGRLAHTRLPAMHHRTGDPMALVLAGA